MQNDSTTLTFVRAYVRRQLATPLNMSAALLSFLFIPRTPVRFCYAVTAHNDEVLEKLRIVETKRVSCKLLYWSCVHNANIWKKKLNIRWSKNMKVLLSHCTATWGVIMWRINPACKFKKKENYPTVSRLDRLWQEEKINRKQSKHKAIEKRAKSVQLKCRRTQ